MKVALRKNAVCIISVYVLIHFSLSSNGQQAYSLSISPSSITSSPALHSGAFAVHSGKWIFLGGRIDGLHIMQSNQAFPANNRNDSIFVVDPVSNLSMAADATQLPDPIYEALCSANMQFYQDADHLYMIGGYGKEAIQNNWITFHSLISVDLPCLLMNINSASPISSCFRQVIDSNMAVAGGMLEKIDSTYYLVFGHRFDGRYARNTTVGGFTQTYTHEIRKFEILDDGTNLSISNYRVESDTNNFHRRDLNLVPQFYPNGEYGFTAFGGVFQKNADLPFLTPIDITSDSTIHQSGFNQNLSQYTSAVMPVFDSLDNSMQTFFFGGMSLYTLDTVSGNLIQDTLVPFVKTISKISRESNGTLTEFKLPVEMPALIGSNAIFIPKDSVPLMHNWIINLNKLSGLTHVGYIVGGIESDLPNVADLDPEGMSRPHAGVYDVYIDKAINSVPDLPIRNSVNDLIVYPNPAGSKLYLGFRLQEEDNCSITLFDTRGKVIKLLQPQTKLIGAQHFVFDTSKLAGGMYYCEVKAGNSVKVVKVILD
jgi:hypothetical protein